MDGARVATCGHSAGGHLALWLAGRHRVPEGMPGERPRIVPVAAVAQAGVCDLEQAWRDGLGGGAVEGLLGSLDAVPDRYAAASPGLPSGRARCHVILVHGDADDIVPVSQSRAYAALDPDAELIELEGADHFDVIDVAHPAWAVVVDRLRTLLAAVSGPFVRRDASRGHQRSGAPPAAVQGCPPSRRAPPALHSEK